MLDSKNENEIDSSMARIRVEDDWTDGPKEERLGRREEGKRRAEVKSV